MQSSVRDRKNALRLEKYMVMFSCFSSVKNIDYMLLYITRY